MKRWMRLAALAFLAVIGAIPITALVIAPYDNLIFHGDSRSVKFGVQATGTEFNRIELVNLTFAGHTSRTATVSAVTGTAYIVSGFQTSSADPGKVTGAISSTTLTVTTANATTGTCSVVIIHAP